MVITVASSAALATLRPPGLFLLLIGPVMFISVEDLIWLLQHECAIARVAASASIVVGGVAAAAMNHTAA